jgi:methylmalonyl-CoA/ethylmalonyl-CoA epimerase
VDDLPRREFFGPSARLHHVGLALADVARAGVADLPLTTDPLQQVRVGFVDVAGCRIELIEPTGVTSPVHKSIEKGNKLVHLCFEVDCLDEALRAAQSQGFKTLREPVPAEAFQGRRISWVYHPAWGLFELLERRAE